MSDESSNYGLQREYDPYRGPFPDLRPPRAEISSSNERTWAALAHLSIFLNLFTGFLGPVASGLIWLVHRDRSRVVALHALRSTVYQVAWLAVMAIGWPITFALMQILIGFLLVPVMLVLSVAPFVYALRAAHEAYTGRSFHYRGRWSSCSYRSGRSSQYV
ncbi:hypothetical protein BH18ACT10_BH18ACT10_02420 [soil metagenome]|nr:DUF4870 domain-containing protein [Rubrobacter sp.]